MIRLATLQDLPALLGLEARCFNGDRFSKRCLIYLLTKAHAINLVAETPQQLCAYCTVLLRRNSPVARLYSIAVAPEMQKQGVAQQLLRAAEQKIMTFNSSVDNTQNSDSTQLAFQQSTMNMPLGVQNSLVLEVREDNEPAIRFYQKQNYQLTGRYKHYYEDGMDALRFKKHLNNTIHHGH